MQDIQVLLCGRAISRTLQPKSTDIKDASTQK